MRLDFWLALCLFFTSTLPVNAQWSESELRILRSLSLTTLSPIPDGLSNRVANDSRAAELGKKIFFDTNFSANGKLSCASCHQPDKYFTDLRKTGVGINETQRNTPTVVASGWLRWFYWDGRRDSLWSQALIPFEAGKEMGSNRATLVWLISQHREYLNLYETIFGAFPKELKTKNKPLPASSLGDAKTQDNWYRLTKIIRTKINTVFANLGKSIAAYERTLLPKQTRFDQYVSQLFDKSKFNIKITEDEIAGIKLFIDPKKTQCMQCHNGSLLTNGGFHNIGSGNFSGKHLDFGRVLGIQSLLIDEFNCLGNYSDAKKKDCYQLRFLDTTQHHIPLKGAFKTPSLRNLGMTAPYFHDGRFNKLSDVIQHYDAPPTDNGDHELKPLNLSELELKQLVAFLQMLNQI